MLSSRELLLLERSAKTGQSSCDVCAAEGRSSRVVDSAGAEKTGSGDHQVESVLAKRRSPDPPTTAQGRAACCSRRSIPAPVEEPRAAAKAALGRATVGFHRSPRWLTVCALVGALFATSHSLADSLAAREGIDPARLVWRWTDFPEFEPRGLTSLTRSSDGVLWFGDADGAWRYDGFGWTQVSLDGVSSSSAVRAPLGSRSSSIVTCEALVSSESRERMTAPFGSPTNVVSFELTVILGSPFSYRAAGASATKLSTSQPRGTAGSGSTLSVRPPCPCT